MRTNERKINQILRFTNILIIYKYISQCGNLDTNKNKTEYYDKDVR